MTHVSFTVVGLPAPQGSKSAFVRGGRAVIVDGSSKAGRQKHLNWREDVTSEAISAQELRGGDQFVGPVSVHIEFFMPLPASDRHRTLHATKPDIDKLVRSVLDSLTTSAIIRDDSQVSALHVTKQYARDGHWTGASIALADMSEAEEINRKKSKETAKAKIGKTRAVKAGPQGGK